MDWATFFKDYPAVIPAVAGLIGIIIGFVFNGWIASRKRKHELEDRDYKSLKDVWDVRIKEALESIDAIIGGNNDLYDFMFGVLLALKSKDDEQVSNELDRATNILWEVKNLSTEALGKFAGIAYLKDKKLLELCNKFVTAGNDMLSEVHEILHAVKNKDMIDLDKTIDKMWGFRRDLSKMSLAIKIRIYELASMQK